MMRQQKELEAVLVAPGIADYLRALRLVNAEPVLEFLMPVRVVSEANERCHHMVRFRRKKQQQDETHVEWKRAARGVKIALPCVVRLIRIGPRHLDDDNLAGAFKGVRDQIARELGADDGSDLIKWQYDQIVAGRRVYGVVVQVYYGVERNEKTGCDKATTERLTRKRPLSPNTLARIRAGLAKFCGLPFVINSGGREVAPRSVGEPLNTVVTRDHLGIVQPFLVKYYGGHDAQSLDEPLPTITAEYEHYGLAQPFIVELRNGQDARSIDQPLSTITTKGMHHALCRPFLVVLRNNANAQSLDEPLRTLAANGQHFGLAQPFLTCYRGNHEGRRDGDHRNVSVDDPIPTLDTSNRFALVQPFIIPCNHGRNDTRAHSVDAPMPSITTLDGWGLIQPFLIAMEHGGHERSIDRPLNTITTARGGAHGLVQPYIVQYNGTADAQSIDDPLNTVTAKDRFALVTPELKPGEEIALLDIHFRMLQPHELAMAMGFPKTYVFTGNREQKVKQIGNAVPVGLAQALCSAILSEEK